MKILTTGGAGYLGSTLVPLLLEGGHDVTVVDRFFFGDGSLPKANEHLRLVRDDTRWCDGRLFEGQDAVVDLAALSNDPAGALDVWKTYEINFLGRSRVARLAREAGARRYVVASSCSLYGFQTKPLTEESPPNPLTAYARANVLVERDNLPLATSEFTTTALRFATLYGLSARMRFDIAINGMVFGAVQNQKIPVMRDGTQWRPFLHVRDAARAIMEVLAAPPERVSGHVFNVGSDEQNFQIRPLAEMVAESLSTPPSLEWYGDPDGRSYWVSFAKVQQMLQFHSRQTPRDAVREIEQALRSGRLTASPQTNTVSWYRHLLADERAGDGVKLHGVVL